MGKHIEISVKKSKVLDQFTTEELIKELIVRSKQDGSKVDFIDCDQHLTTRVLVYPKHANDYLLLKNLNGDAVPNHYELMKNLDPFDRPYFLEGTERVFVPMPTEGCTCTDCRIEANM